MSISIINTLRKLLEQERGAYSIGSFAEADAFATKFRSLMLSHDLTMADLGYVREANASIVSFDHPVTRRTAVRFSVANEQWQTIMVAALASEIGTAHMD